MERLSDLSLEDLRAELSRQVHVRDTLLEEALELDQFTFGTLSDEERREIRQRTDDAMERLYLQNRDVVGPLE